MIKIFFADQGIREGQKSALAKQLPEKWEITGSFRCTPPAQSRREGEAAHNHACPASRGRIRGRLPRRRPPSSWRTPIR